MSRTTLADRLAAVVLLAAVVPRGWAVMQSWFWQDDLVIASMARRQGLSIDYLLQDYHGHLTPAKFAVVWVLATMTPGNWSAAASIVVVLALASVATWWWALRTVFGPRLPLLAPLSLIAFGPLMTVPLTWWAAALDALPMQIAMAVVIVGHVRAVRDGRRSGAALSVLALVVGLFWIEKVLLVLLVVAWLDIVLLRNVDVAWRPRGRLQLWLGYAVVALSYLTLYRRLVPDPTDRSWDGDEIGRFLYDSVLSTFPVGVLSGPWQTMTDSSTLLPLIVQPWLMTVWILGLAVVAVSFVVRGRAAWRGWVLLIVYLATAVGLVATTRLDFLGPVIGRDPRYLADVVPVAALALAAAFLPPLGERRLSRARSLSLPTTSIVVGLIVAYFLLSWVSTYRIADARGATGAEEWVRSTAHSLGADPNAVLYDVAVPPFVVASFFNEYTQQSRVLDALGIEARFDEPTTELKIIDGKGHLVDSTFIVSAAGARGPDDSCGWPVEGRPVTIPLPSVEPSSDWVVRLGYYAGEQSEPRVDLGTQSWSVPLPAGLHELFLFPGAEEVDDLRFSGLDAGQSLCVTDVDVGRGWPQGRP